jgi:RimJ/RimL family protein N-acetyltransferase
VRLESSRLLLDAFRGADAAAVHLGCQDADVQRFRAAPTPFGVADSERFVRSTVPSGWAEGTAQHWAIRRKGLPGLIGVIGVRLFDGDVGYWIDARWRHQGLAREALGTVADFRFTQGQPMLRWETLAGNVASARVAAAVGFRYLGERVHRAPGDTSSLTWWQAQLARDDARSPASGWPGDEPLHLAS